MGSLLPLAIEPAGVSSADFRAPWRGSHLGQAHGSAPGVPREDGAQHRGAEGQVRTQSQALPDLCIAVIVPHPLSKGPRIQDFVPMVSLLLPTPPHLVIRTGSFSPGEAAPAAPRIVRASCELFWLVWFFWFLLEVFVIFLTSD